MIAKIISAIPSILRGITHIENRGITNAKKFDQLYPWLVWALASSFVFYKYVLQISPTVMLPELMGTFHLTGEAMGHLAACYFYAYLLMQLPAGYLLDQYNPKRLIATAIFVCGLGGYLFSIADSMSLAIVGRILIGLGGAFSAVGTMKLISLWFPPRQFAIGSGLMMTMAMLGAICGAGPLTQLVTQFGWRHALQICVCLGILLGIVIVLVVRNKATDRTPPATAPFAKTPGKTVISIISNRQSWLIALYSGIAFAPISAFAGLWGLSFLTEQYNLTRSVAANLISLIFVGFAFGSPFAGWLSDRISRRKPIMIIGTALSTILLTVIICVQLPNLWLLGSALLLFGLFSGFFFVSFAHIREINPRALSGTSIGFINLFNAACGAVSEPLIGKLLDLNWDGSLQQGVRHFSAQTYQQALLLLPMSMLIALLLHCWIKESYCQQIDKEA